MNQYNLFSFLFSAETWEELPTESKPDYYRYPHTYIYSIFFFLYMLYLFVFSLLDCFCLFHLGNKSGILAALFVFIKNRK